MSLATKSHITAGFFFYIYILLSSSSSSFIYFYFFGPVVCLFLCTIEQQRAFTNGYLCLNSEIPVR